MAYEKELEEVRRIKRFGEELGLDFRGSFEEVDLSEGKKSYWVYASLKDKLESVIMDRGKPYKDTGVLETAEGWAKEFEDGGHDVSLMARGERLAQLRQHGLVLENAQTGEQSTYSVNLVEKLASEDAYDLVLVILRKNSVAGVLPVLAANQHTPSVVFLMNNAAGPGEFVEALGRERVLIGFPASAGNRRGHVIRYLGGSAEHAMTIPFGEVDGRITKRTYQVADVFDSMPGYRAQIRIDMDAWSKTHVALLMPGLAAALYACGTDRMRLARTRDGIVLATRAIRESFAVLQALDVPIVPKEMRYFAWLPEPLLIAFVRYLMSREEMETAMVGHAEAARDEMKHLADEFRQLAEASGVPTPCSEQLYAYFDPATPLIPDGSATIPLEWRNLAIMSLGLAGIAAFLLAGIVQKRKR